MRGYRSLVRASLQPRRTIKRLLPLTTRGGIGGAPQSLALLVVVDDDISDASNSLQVQGWPTVRLLRLSSERITAEKLAEEAGKADADYVLILSDCGNLDGYLLRRISFIVARNPGFDIWISGLQLGYWSWSFSRFTLDTSAILLLRSSLISERVCDKSRSRRNCKRIYISNHRDLPLRSSFISNTPFASSAIQKLVADLPLALPRLYPIVNPRLVVVIPTRDKADLLEQAVASLEKQKLSIPIELVIVDNGSVKPETNVLLQKLVVGPIPVQILRDKRSFNFSALCNQGIGASQAPLVLLMNNDLVFTDENSLEAMLQFASYETIGCIGAKLSYPDGRVQHLGVELSADFVRHQLYGMRIQDNDNLQVYPRQVSAITAACMLFRRSLWEELGGLDEQLPVDFNDVDFCMRAQMAGFVNLVVPSVNAVHLESASRGTHLHSSFSSSLEIVKARWGKYVGNDPFALAFSLVNKS